MVIPKDPKANNNKSPFPSWFRNGDSCRVQWFAFWLLLWNCAALADALAFTFSPTANLNGYYGVGTWNEVTYAQTRMLANCQLGLVSMVTLVGLTGTERQIHLCFRILTVVTIGAFRGVYLGMTEGSILPIFESAWASLLSVPPFIFLIYFSFWY